MIARLSRPCAMLLVALFVAGGLWLRFQGLARDPFWLDEAYSAFAAAHDWHFLWTVVPTYETHPPVYYSLVHLWRAMFGDGVLALRLPGAILGAFTIAAIGVAGAALARLGQGRAFRLAAAAAALASVHPELVMMSRQVRPYPVMILVYALALIPLVAIARARGDGKPLPRGSLAGYAAAELAMLWLHSLGPLFAGAMGLALLAVCDLRRLDRRGWAWLVASQAAAILLWLPGALILAAQAQSWVASTWLVFRPEQLWTSLGQLYTGWSRPARWLGLLLGLAGAVQMGTRVRERPMLAALLLLGIVPVAASLALTLAVAPVFLVRTLSPVAAPALLLIARGACPRGLARHLALLPLAALLLVLARIDRDITAAPPMQDWYAALRWLGPRAGAGDEIWAYPNEGALPLAYAMRDLAATGSGPRLRVRAVPTIVPATGWRGVHPTGSMGVVSLFPDQIAALAASPQACAPRTLWLLRLGPWAYDKGDRMLNALAARRERVGAQRWGPIDIVGLRRNGRC